MPAPRKFIEQYEKEATRLPNGCLIHKAARVARRCYILRHGPLTTFQYVCHTCDEPQCIENNHHFLGTPLDNVTDAVRKGRHSCFAPPNGRGMVGQHSEDTKRRISASLKRMWKERRHEATS